MPFIPIVRSKLHRPRIVGDFIVRSSLLQRVEAGSVLPLTLLAAPAGYGKTSLVAHWLESREGLAAWLSLDAEDSDLVVFVSYFVAAVRTAVPGACADTLDCLAAGQPASLAALAGHLSNDLEALPARLVLVLDDYHRIVSRLTHALLDRLLAHPVGNLHLVMISCRDPPLSLGMLRAREALTEIRMPDLQFAASDTALLFERCTGRAVSASLLKCLQQRSEGWPVGVRLAALALRDGGEAAELERGFTGSTPQVQQFFIEEVLSQQSAGVRDWLLRTSISDRFCAALGDALSAGCVVGEGEERLEGRSFIQRVASGAMLCLAVDENLEWYRYHCLFRTFLESQLRKQHTDAEVVELHRRAAAWFEANGLFEEAIPHVLAAAGATAAGQLLARHRNALLNREHRHRLQRCLCLLPADTIEMDPELLLLKAWLMHHQGRQIETPVVLDRIEALLEGDAGGLDQIIVASLRGSVLALRSLQRYREGRADLALACAEQALHSLADDSPHARVTAQAVVAGTRQMTGDLKGARRWIHDALTRASGSIEVCQAPLVATLCFLDWMAADLSALQWTASQNDKLNDAQSQGNWALGRYFLGLVQYQRNELALAEATLLPALAVQYAPRLGYRTEISFVLAAVYQALGQADRAREIVDAVCEHLLRTGNSPALFRAGAYQAELALRQGRVDEAQEWARNFDPGPVQLVYRFFNAPHLTLARVWIAEGSAENREQAGHLLQLLQADLAARHNIRFLIEVLALQALLQRAQGDEVAACDLLARAVALAQPGGFVRLFVDLGQDLVPILKRLNPGIGRARYVGQILSAMNDDWLVNAGRQQVGADLTRRELKILKLLAVRLSNVEISEELCISRATVKRHTQNIYRKLRASSRREAVLRARTLNILADG